MAISRRTALALVSASALFPQRMLGANGRPVYLSALTTSDWTHGAALLDGDGPILARFDLPERGHGAAVNPRTGHAILFARRPGTFAAVIDLRARRLVRLFSSPEGRHFYGHGCISPDGRWLFATENDFDGEKGVLGLYDCDAGYRRVGELSSHGIGPHEVVLMPDGETLAVANGGILTHPSAPRMKLNVSEMDPSLVLMSLADGRIKHRLRPPEALHKLSIRHLAANRAGIVAMAMQWEGNEEEGPPLVGLWTAGSELRMVAAPEPVQRSMKNYGGSVAFNAAGDRFMVSAPRGGILGIWDAEGAFDRAVPLADGSGIAAASETEFLATNGLGEIVQVGSGGGEPDLLATTEGLMWDNHLTLSPESAS